MWGVHLHVSTWSHNINDFDVISLDNMLTTDHYRRTVFTCSVSCEADRWHFDHLNSSDVNKTFFPRTRPYIKVVMWHMLNRSLQKKQKKIHIRPFCAYITFSCILSFDPLPPKGGFRSPLRRQRVNGKHRWGLQEPLPVFFSVVRAS